MKHVSPTGPPLPRIDPYTAAQLAAAGLVVAIPTLLAFLLGLVLADAAVGIVWGLIVGVVAGSVIVTSALITYVGVIPAVLGISGVWGLAALLIAWIVPICPAAVGDVCGPRQYATIMAVGMFVPWVVLVFVVPFAYGFRAIGKFAQAHRKRDGA